MLSARHNFASEYMTEILCFHYSKDKFPLFQDRIDSQIMNMPLMPHFVMGGWGSHIDRKRGNPLPGPLSYIIFAKGGKRSSMCNVPIEKTS